jgi:hypothetical protein
VDIQLFQSLSHFRARAVSDLPNSRTADIIALNDLLCDHWERIDRVIEDLVTDLFTDDGEMQIGTLHRKGRDDIQAYAVDRRAGEDANGRRTRHLMSNVRVFFEGERQAEMRFLLTVFAGRGAMPFEASVPSNIADFAATCRKEDDGKWRIASLRGKAIFAGPEAPPNARG